MVASEIDQMQSACGSHNLQHVLGVSALGEDWTVALGNLHGGPIGTLYTNNTTNLCF